MTLFLINYSLEKGEYFEATKSIYATVDMIDGYGNPIIPPRMPKETVR